ncbi:MAG: hypothetical protein A2252_04105 [Elusimicrobia bacterium RIFOXYA2_FULL_39_19]|nr:MAG: hypothetical protein A2252_04105 [Elusimicrobia bacterium RIFOXYA2_FULL_39_19]
MKKTVFVFLAAVLSFNIPFIYGEDSSINVTADGSVNMVITATRRPHILKNTPIATNLITNEDIKAAGAANAADALRLVPGLDTSGGAPFGSALRTVGQLRGLPSQYTLILIDGKKAKSEHMNTGTNIAIIPASLIDRVEIVKGAGSAVYGSDAFGGVVNVITKSAPDKLTLEAGGAYGSLETKNFNFTLGNKCGKTGFLAGLNSTDSAGINNSWYKARNVLLRNGVTINDNNEFNFLGKYYQNEYKGRGTPTTDKNWDTSLSWKTKTGELSSLTFNNYITEFFNTKNDLNKTTEISCVYQASVANKHFFTAGLEASKDDFRGTAIAYNTRSIASAFFEDEFSVNNSWELLGALRFDSLPDNSCVVSPKINVLKKLDNTLNLRASAGKGFRAPSLSDLYEKDRFHSTFYRNGNPDLKPEYSIDYSLGADKQFFSGLMAFSLQLFKNDLANMIHVENTGTTLNGLPVIMQQNVISAYSQGAETALNLAKNDFDAKLCYTFVDSKDNTGNCISYLPKNSVKLVLSYTPQSIKAGATVSGERVMDRFYVDPAGAQQRLADYTLVNINLTKNLFKSLDMYVTIGNALDEIFFTYEENVQASYGRTYNAGVNYKFF